ncbi:MAG: UDP-N-acetylmuramyl tripeptide synthase [Arenicella sp.]
MKLVLDEVRRLTGPNLLWDKPGAILDIEFDSIDESNLVESWQRWSSKCLLEVGWNNEQSTYRLHAHGANLAISAPLDSLYIACDLAELILSCCESELQSTERPDWAAECGKLKALWLAQSNQQLLALVEAANKAGVVCLIDDDEVSLGLGATSKIWPIDNLPTLESVQWQDFSSIPIAFITGTNGKSTCVRLAAAIAKEAAIEAGVTSTDFIKVGDRVIDYGDYSGPGGARLLLRDQQTEMAFLEVARGGLLRRGLPIMQVDAALITNVASDHLGEYGVNTLAELAETKFMVSKALSNSDVLVLNADNQASVTQAQNLDKNLDKTICWFSTSESNPIIQQQIKLGGRAVYIKANKFVYHESGDYQQLIDITEAPITFNGTAPHNIQNALGVIGLCKALMLPNEAINSGLKLFGLNRSDNPGRGNSYQFNDIRVIVDFAHNDHGVSALVEMAKKMPAKRRLVMFGHAGDRSDADIVRATDAVARMQADVYILSELKKYLRGREGTEIAKLVTSTLQQGGIESEKIKVSSDPLAGAKLAMSLARPGDLVLLFTLDERQAVDEFLSQQVSSYG